MSNATFNNLSIELLGFVGQPSPARALPISGACHVYAGTMLTNSPLDANKGYVQPAFIHSSSTVVGIASQEFDNSLSASNPYITVPMVKGVWSFQSVTGSGALTFNNVDQNCYAYDDHTVTMESGSAPGRPIAGKVYQPDFNHLGFFFVQFI